MNVYSTRNDLLLNNLLDFYKDCTNIDKMLNIITGESKISLRIVDWFVTNYAKKNYTLYTIESSDSNVARRFKVYVDYKLKLKAYGKLNFDSFCRWSRISIPYKDGKYIETTIGQLNFFKWAIENNVLKYIEANYTDIESDMNSRNSTSRKKEQQITGVDNSKTRKKREELSVSASKSIKKEEVEIVVKFN
jgi:hypothetical protein